MLKVKSIEAKSIFSWVLIISIMVSLFSIVIPFPVSAAKVGSVEMSGDSGFDSDSIANSDTNQYRWLSYPGARFSLNPSSSEANSKPGPMASNLPLNIGGFLYNGTKNILNVVNVQMSTTGGGANNASTVSTTWYPYKITFGAAYNTPGNVSISGYDFFADANSSIIRVIQVNGSTGKDLILSGTIPSNTSAQWDSTNKVLVVTDSLYYSALRFVSLSGSGLTSSDIAQTPSISGNTWTLRIPLGTTSGNYYGISYAYAANTEGMSTAVSRARNCFNQGVTTTLANTKNVFDTYLRKVPKPLSFGIWSGINSFGVTADQHRKAYYGAWTFILTNYMDVLPENASAFNYKQVLCGKPSLWANGANYNKGSCAWESFLGQQWLSYIMPEEAWNAFKGTMSLVDANGYIPGEVLPSRKAQTAWIVYKNGGCSLSELTATYSTIKRYLLWLENNPRWIFSGHDYTDEKDIEFCTSFIFDADFAIKIAKEIGQNQDVSMWQVKQANMTSNIRTWFLSTPDTVNQFYFTNTGAHYYGDRTSDSAFSCANAIIANGLTSSENTSIINYFKKFQNVNTINNGFNGYKYPVVSFDVYGLMNKGFITEARNYLNCSIRDTVNAGDFSEGISGAGSPDGVLPSIFTAAGMIDFTLMNNGLMTYTGTPTAIDWSGVIPVEQVFYKIKNSWTGKYLNIENNTGKVECGNLGGDWGTAKWILEDAGLGNFRIKNMWTNQYLHIENNLGYVQYGTLGGDWASAKWKLESMGGYWRLNNVWKSDQYIHVENSLGYAESSSLGGDWGTAKWVLEPVSTDDATFYQHINYGGTSVTLAKGNYTLSQLNALGIPNDWVSSIKVPAGWTVEVYQNDNFAGTKWTFTSSTNYVEDACNDQMSSVKIY